MGTMNRSIRYFGFVQMPDPSPPFRSNAGPGTHPGVKFPPRGHESWSNARGLPGGRRFDRWGIVISKLPIQRYGCKIAENIVISGIIDWQGGETELKRTKSKVDKEAA